VALALPWLESLAPRIAKGQGLAARKRFLPIFFPNGSPHFFRPAATGSGEAWKLSPLLEPFAPLKKKFTVLSNVENYTPFQPDNPDVEPSHGRAPGAFLACVDASKVRQDLKISGDGEANGISVDQVIAQHANYKDLTKLGSLQVGTSTIESNCDGKPCSISRSISWKSQTQPLYKEVDPVKVFDLIMAGSTPINTGESDAEANKRRALNKSVLDAVYDNANHTRNRLGKSDQLRMDEFMDFVRAVERQVGAVAGTMNPTLPGACENKVAPEMRAQYGLKNGQNGYNKGTHTDVMNDLIVLALQCDATRIISYMLEDERSEFVYDHVAQRKFTTSGSTVGDGRTCGNYHGSQHGGDTNNDFASIIWWQAQKVSELCQKLDAIVEEDGKSILDNSIVLFASCMHGGNHYSNDLPVALIGGGGGMLNTDQHVLFAKERPMRDLHYTIMNKYFELGVTEFGVNTQGVPHRLIEELIKA
jgi:hypothetical protein